MRCSCGECECRHVAGTRGSSIVYSAANVLSMGALDVKSW